jgi:Fic family protein
MTNFSNRLVDAVVQTDRYVASNPALPDRIRSVLQLAAFGFGTLVQIHPFINGNGRMSRLLCNYILCRYGYEMPFYSSHPRPNHNYATASQACMTGDFRGMYQYLLLVLSPTLN